LEPITLVIVPSIVGGVVIALLIARWNRRSAPTPVRPSDGEPPPTDFINMARIPVAGIGGLGFVAMAVVTAIAIPRIRQTVGLGLVLGVILAIVLLRWRRPPG
jgi:hypothetical protein